MDHLRIRGQQARYMESETLDSKIAKGIMKIILADFRRRSSLLEEEHKSQAKLCIRSCRSSALKKKKTREIEDEGARLAPFEVVQRQPQDAQSNLERNFDGSGE